MDFVDLPVFRLECRSLFAIQIHSLTSWIGSCFFTFGTMILVLACWVVVVLLCTGTLHSLHLVDS